MRLNEPITQREFDLPDHVTLMSTTDTQSHLRYANDAFIAVSGFSRAEIEGQPHNIVRHPDMPREAFADMWATLKAGRPWTGLVKNRRKDGDHYWVRANAVPVVRHGQHVGYMSVRTKPTREEVAGAESLYSELRNGRGQRRLYRGTVLRTGLASILNLGQTLSTRGRIRLTLAVLWALSLVAGMVWGANGTALLALGGMAAAGCLAASITLERQIAKPLESLLEQALAVATGASRGVEHMDRVDEIGMTMRTVGQLGLMFRWIIDDVSQQVLSLQTAIAEIAQGNDDLSARTEQAAASVEQTSSAMEQMTGTVKANAETAEQADQLSGSASEAATAGGAAVSHVMTTMGEITASSRRIADIIGVIDGIAFQTNILALNAAVEAARAGEQGRGFAVVAGEVRSLSQRTAAAAKEIKSLIGEGVEKAEQGAKLVEDAGNTMKDIVARVSRVSDLIGEISAATRDQSAGIGEVGKAVGHLDDITQQNAALVEQSAAASRSLKQQAGHLADAVSVFR